MYFYSATTNSFYHDSVHTTFPDDVVRVSDEAHTEIFKKLAEGLVLTADKQGKPVAVVPESNVTWDDIRTKRNRLLKGCDYTQLSDFPGSSDVWAKYRQALRDIPQTSENPADVVWPTKPTQ